MKVFHAITVLRYMGVDLAPPYLDAMDITRSMLVILVSQCGQRRLTVGARRMEHSFCKKWWGHEIPRSTVYREYLKVRLA